MPVFLLSPARCNGRRAKVLFNPDASFDLAVQIRKPEGAPIGEVFSFLSGLYFRGKLTYARTFGAATTYIITTNRGLMRPEDRVGIADLERFGDTDLSTAGESFVNPLLINATEIAHRIPVDTTVVLLGSIATAKYVEPLMRVFGERLLFPVDFVGRGDMSRGGLLLRHAADGKELDYVPVATAVRHGKRPPKLERRA